MNIEDTTLSTGTMNEEDSSAECHSEHLQAENLDVKEENIPDKFSHAYWTQRWHPSDRGWHRDDVNCLLESNVERLLNGRANVRTFFPLCGMAIDMLWLAKMGHSIVGVEFIESAVKAFFENNNLGYTVHDLPCIDGHIYKAMDVSLELYCCDYYDLTVDIICQFDAIWDRGSLVAVDQAQRKRYSEVLLPLMASDCRYLLSVYAYDKTKFSASFNNTLRNVNNIYDGPPCVIDESDLSDLYGSRCNFELLEKVDSLTQKHRDWGLDYFYENIYLITKKG